MRLPAKHGRWRAQTVKAWESWWESPAAASWTPAQVAAAERLLMLVDELAGSPDAKLAKEVRLAEASLGLGKPPPKAQQRHRRIAEQEDAMAEAKAVRAWSASGCTGPRPETPLLDAKRAALPPRNVARERAARELEREWEREAR